MKILIISHNIFSNSSNMGKTLSGYFRELNFEDIAQFYIHSEVPTLHSCQNYYRITDKEMLSSILTRKSGKIFRETDIHTNADQVRTDTGLTAKLYQKSRSRTPLIYLMRNLWWSLGAWNTKKFNKWVDEFKPDCIFFVSGDYAFMYKIALKTAQKRNIPMIVSCMDDHYFYNRNENKFLGKLAHQLFMKQVKKTIQYASAILPICDTMSRDYQAFFKKPCYTIHTASTLKEPLCMEKKNKISYIGNLGLGREKQLLTIAKALQSIEVENCPKYIDVYSAETRPEILANLTEENGIRFHGRISPEEVLQIMGESLAVIHTESFDAEMRKRVKYSVSTKIADSLASGTPLLAYGPEEVASMQHLICHNAAFCATDPSELKTVLTNLIINNAMREKVVQSALALAKSKHINNNAKVLIESVFCNATQNN